MPPVQGHLWPTQEKTARSSPQKPGTTKRAVITIFALKRTRGRTTDWTETCHARRVHRGGSSGRISLYWQGENPNYCCDCRVCCCCDTPHGSSAGCCSTTRRVEHGWSLLPGALFLLHFNYSGAHCAMDAARGKKKALPNNCSCCAKTLLLSHCRAVILFPVCQFCA